MGDLAYAADHGLGDQAPHRGEGDGFLLYLLSRLGRCLILGRRRRRRRRALCGLNVEKQVVPGYAPTQTGPPHLGQVNSVLSGQPPYRGRGPSRSAGRCSGGFRAGRLLTLTLAIAIAFAYEASGGAHRPDVLDQVAGGAAIFRPTSDVRSRGRLSRLCRGWWLRVLGRRLGGLHLGDGSPHGHRFPFRDQYSQEGPINRGGHLHGHLVRDHLHQRIIPADGISRLLQPLADGALNYRFSDVGKLDGYVQGCKPRN